MRSRGNARSGLVWCPPAGTNLALLSSPVLLACHLVFDVAGSGPESLKLPLAGSREVCTPDRICLVLPDLVIVAYCSSESCKDDRVLASMVQESWKIQGEFQQEDTTVHP